MKAHPQSTTFEFPKGVTSIEEYAFGGCSSLRSIELLEGINSIGAEAFRGCSRLESIVIPKGVTSIGFAAFGGCSALEAIKIPEGAESIGGRAFQGCSSLASIVISEGVTNIGLGAFAGCSSLESIELPEGLESIEEAAFFNCSGLKEIKIPEGAESIGGRAFVGCRGLRSIKLPNKLERIGSSAFSGCSRLQSIVTPEGVTNINTYAFSGCSELQSIVIPEGVTSIKEGVFSGCDQLSYIIAPEHLHEQLTEAYPDKIVIALQQAIAEGKVVVDEPLCDKLIKYIPVNNLEDNSPKAIAEKIRSSITSLSPLAKASLFSYRVPANHHWKDLTDKQVVSALGDAPAYLLNLIGYRALNRGGFAIMNNKDMGDEVIKHISIKDRLNLAMVANGINLGVASIAHDQNTRGVDDQDANSHAIHTDQASSCALL
ncbi:MAG: leucine-rich repeat domain-containing protein [Pseudomonadota bacterium]|nr:leucine-rich repeat domain-containing protein [Pseudomonadota bacterium]